MVINEHSRHELYGKLEQVLGDQAATTLMEHLPPVGWADVATKQDLRVLEQRMDMRFEVVEMRFGAVDGQLVAMRSDLDALEQCMDMKLENLENRMLAAFRAELMSQTRAMIFTMVGSVFTAVSITLATVKLG